MSAPPTLWFNPRCSKCRTALSLLEEHGVEPVVVEYLVNPPTAEELRAVVRKLGLPPEALVRKGEAVYKEKYAGRTLTDDEWIEAMLQHPILIERPILVTGDRAVIGRPPEKVLPLVTR